MDIGSQNSTMGKLGIQVKMVIRARCSSVVRAFAHGAMGSKPHGGPTKLFLVSATAPRLVCVILSMGWCI